MSLGTRSSWLVAASRQAAPRAAVAALVLLAPTGFAVAGAPRASQSAEGSHPADEATVRIERRVAAMGTELVITVEAADRVSALAASEQALAAVEAAERRLSTWRPDSELAGLNRDGAARELSPELAGDLAAAETCAQATGGAFDPTVGALVHAWGLRSGGRQPTAVELAAALAETGAAHLHLVPGRAWLDRPGVRLDEGGFGKGAGLAAAVAVLAANGGASRAVLDFGGQLAFWGRGAAVTAWRVALADPADRERPVIALEVAGGSLATSGNSERGIVAAGIRRAHLLDPRSGWPAADFGSLTVWVAPRGFAPGPGAPRTGGSRALAADPGEAAADAAAAFALATLPTALAADCLSTGLYVLGPEAALAWAASHAGVEVLVLERRGVEVVARVSCGLAGRLEPLTTNVRVESGCEAGAEDRGGVAPTGEQTRAAVPSFERSGPSALSNPVGSRADTPGAAKSEEKYR